MRIRFSLKFLLTLILVVALGVAWATSAWRYRQVQARYDLLVKDWIDTLVVADPDKFLVRQLPTRRIGIQQWRIHVPDDQTYELCCGVGPSIDGAEQLTKPVARVPLKPGQSVIEVEWHRQLDGRPDLAWAILSEQSQVTLRPPILLPTSFCADFAKLESFGFSFLGSDTPKVHPAGQPFALFRAFPNLGTDTPPETASTPHRDGVLVWIQPTTPPP